MATRSHVAAHAGTRSIVSGSRSSGGSTADEKQRHL